MTDFIEQHIEDEECAEVRAYTILACISLIHHLYFGLRQGAGGPLHIVVDDYNVDDHWVKTGQWENYAYLFDGRFERYCSIGEPSGLAFKRNLMVTCEAICAALSSMPEEWRRVTCVLASTLDEKMPVSGYAHTASRELMEAVTPSVHAHLKSKYGLDEPDPLR